MYKTQSSKALIVGLALLVFQLIKWLQCCLLCFLETLQSASEICATKSSFRYISYINPTLQQPVDTCPSQKKGFCRPINQTLFSRKHIMQTIHQYSISHIRFGNSYLTQSLRKHSRQHRIYHWHRAHRTKRRTKTKLFDADLLSRALRKASNNNRTCSSSIDPAPTTTPSST